MEPTQSSKLFPVNHKTVFLLDHTPYFTLSCGDNIEFGYSSRPGFIPLAPVSKSLWTCSVEAAMDYSRIVWDLFPEGKLIRFCISDNTGRSLNTWAPEHQNIYQVFGSLSGCGAPPKLTANTANSDYSIVHGFKTSIEAMCECSEAQHRKRTSLSENATELQNRCRMICITSARDNDSVRNLEEIFSNELAKMNRNTTSTDHLVAVNHCHLIIINVYPNTMQSSLVTGHPPFNKSSILTTEVYSVVAGTHLAPKMTDLLLSHYNLASTTVIGIPMKEEQNASSSANYNVELFHAADAHTALLRSNVNELSQISALKEGAIYETVTLKWCTPRNNNMADLHNCTTLHRITPAEVNSRPSACLITFLLNGRTVMLETPKKVGSKGMSHMLTSYGGEIFIQTLNMGRSVLDDPPSISEGVGGRVTDYRIADFGLLIKENKLLPLKRKYLAEKEENGKEPELPITQAKERLNKFTKYWPLTMSATFIFNCRQITEPLISNMLNDVLSQEELLQCKQCIYNLISMESKNEPLPIVSSVGHRGKGPKREEQYKALWAELESYIKLHNYSKEHNEIINCLVECRKKPESLIKLEKTEIEQALKGYEHDRGQMMQRETVIRATYDSPLSPPPCPANGNGTENGKMSTKPRSLYELYMSKKKRNEKLAGELKGVPTSTGYITRLYPQLSNEELPQSVKPVVEQ